MAFANVNVSDLIATGIESRTGEIADNVTGNNPVTAQLKKKGRIKTVSGGHKIYEELSFAENPNGGAYSGYDPLPTAPADVISAAEFSWKQYAVPVVISGLEEIQNGGKEGLIDLLDSRLEVAEATMANLIEEGVYGDGSAYGGKAITGLAAAVEATAIASQTSTYGGISRTNYSFWRNYYANPNTNTAATLQAAMTTAYGSLTRGADAPDLIILGAQQWGRWMASLQVLQRFTEPGSADLGFPTTRFMNADVVLGGGIGGVVDTTHMLFLNTKYLRFRPHSRVNMSPYPRRLAFNQDSSVQGILWAGNLTCRGAQFQGRVVSAD